MFESGFASTDEEGQGDEEVGEKALQEEAKRAKTYVCISPLPFCQAWHIDRPRPARHKPFKTPKAPVAQSDVRLARAPRETVQTPLLVQGEGEAAAPCVAGAGRGYGDGRGSRKQQAARAPREATRLNTRTG